MSPRRTIPLLASLALAACAQTTGASPRDAAVTDVAALHDNPAAFDTPSLVDVPARPDLPAIPDLPAVTDVPAIPDLPARPDLPASTDLPAVTDVPASTDGPPLGRDCQRATDCRRDPFFPQTFAQGWSCIQGQCTWEQRSGRTCVRDGDGCYACDDGARTCPGAACLASLRREDLRVERAYCARDFLASRRACLGGFVELDDMVCTLTDAPTGAIRWVLACGPCEFVFTPSG